MANTIRIAAGLAILAIAAVLIVTIHRPDALHSLAATVILLAAAVLVSFVLPLRGRS